MKMKVKSAIVTPSLVRSVNPKLHWIWADFSGFPKNILIDEKSYMPEALKEFADAILLATKRVWIMDPYFDKKIGLNSLWMNFSCSDVLEIKIISHEAFDSKWPDELEDEFDMKMKAKLEWRIGFSQLHDRFAIIDDEMWHFGSTVGGGYYKFGAATSGWTCDLLDKVFLAQWERCGK